MTSSKSISVFIPVYNGEKYIAECIEAILAQDLPEQYTLELLITDSGSSDQSVPIIKSYARLHEDIIVFNTIDNSDFGHGKTRQEAARKSRGDFVLFLSQDATPFNKKWLLNMLEPFFLSENVGCVFGRQIPRKHAPPSLKREVSSVFDPMGKPGTVIIQKNGSWIDGTIDSETNNFFSDVNSAVRKELIEKIPFRNVKYAEDQALAQDLQQAGFLKAYSPDGAVEHTNEYSAREYYHRKFDEYLGLHRSVGYSETPRSRDVLVGWIKPTIRDWIYLFRDRKSYKIHERIMHALTAPLYNLYKELGRRNAFRHKDDLNYITKNSLEELRKQR